MPKKYYEATIRGGNGSRPDAIARVIVPGKSLADAGDIIERLICHGHSVSGMCDGVSADAAECAAMEGYDAASRRADAAMIYAVFPDELENGPEDDLELISIREVPEGEYQAASKSKDTNKCDHDRENITWQPDAIPDGNDIFYRGVCKCGQKVKEVYNSTGIYTDDEQGKFICE